MTIAKWPRLTFFLGDTKVVKMAPAHRGRRVLMQFYLNFKDSQKFGKKMVDIYIPLSLSQNFRYHTTLALYIPTSIVAKIRLKRGNYNYMCVTVF